MAISFVSKSPLLKRYQIPLSVFIVIGVSIALFYSVPLWGYRVPALVLLMVVSLFGLVFDIVTVVLSCVLSALIWNFFFIPPLFTFHIANGEDGLMFFMYFIMALVHSLLSFKIKEAEKIQRDKEDKESTIKLYNTLLNSLSHELKTPIAAIIGAVDTIQHNEMNLSEKNKLALINEIRIAGWRLNKEVENLLNMSRLESGSIKLKIDWADINEVVNMVLEKLEDKLGKHIIIFQPDDAIPLIKIDSILIEQVLYNLVNNALLYTPAGTSISISASVQNEICELVISDNGPGFPEAARAKAFNMFYRQPHHKTGGSGLGLSIAKGFVEAHQGTIMLLSNEGEGATFTIQIPVATSYIKNLNNE